MLGEDQRLRLVTGWRKANLIRAFLHPKLTAERLVPPGSNIDPTVLAFIDIGLNGFTQDGPGSVQLTQVKDTVPEVVLETHRNFVGLQSFIFFYTSLFYTSVSLGLFIVIGDRLKSFGVGFKWTGLF